MLNIKKIWLLVYEYFIDSLVFIITKKNKDKYKKSVVILDGGIGDAVIALNLLQSLCVNDSIILCSEKSLPILCKHLPKHIIYTIGDFNLNDLSDILCNVILLKCGSAFKKNLLRLNIADKYIVFNPLYDRISPLRRVMNIISIDNKRQFYNTHMKTIFAEMLSVNLPAKNINCKIFNNCIGIHVAGADAIRRLRVDILRKLIVRRSSLNFFLIGAADDFEEYKSLLDLNNVRSYIGKVDLWSLSDILNQMDVVICPDSMIMHYSDYLGIPVIAIMGNALVETYGPYNKGNFTVSRVPSCSPCGRISCDKFNGFSCVQDVSADEILKIIDNLAGE